MPRRDALSVDMNDGATGRVVVHQLEGLVDAFEAQGGAEARLILFFIASSTLPGNWGRRRRPFLPATAGAWEGTEAVVVPASVSPTAINCSQSR